MKILSLVILVVFLFSHTVSAQISAPPKTPAAQKQPVSPAGPAVTPATPAPPSPAAPSRTPFSPGVPIPDQPLIQEFSATPDIVPAGGQVTLRWTVIPGSGGSRITNVSLQKTGGALSGGAAYNGPNASSSLPFVIPATAADQTVEHTLTATNEAGRTSSRRETFEVKSVNTIKEHLTFMTSNIEPREVREGERFDFTLAFSNLNDFELSYVTITVLQTNDRTFRTGTVVSDVSSLRIQRGRNDFRLPCPTGLRRENGELILITVLYRSQEILKVGSSVRPESRTFFTMP